MTIAERKALILARIAEIQQGGNAEEIEDMQNALETLGVNPNG